MDKVWIVVWESDGEFDAQAYTSREAATRDFPEFDEGDLTDKTLVESTVQK